MFSLVSFIIKPHQTILVSRLCSSHHFHHAVHFFPKSISAVHYHAHNLLDEMPQRDPASYDSAIASLVRNGLVSEACALLSRMISLGLRPTRFSFVPILSAHAVNISHGTQMHTLLLKNGLLHSDPYSATALMGHYRNNERMDNAAKLFDEMPVRTVVTWNCIIAGFSQLGWVEHSLFLFRELLRGELRLSESSFVGVLSGF